MYILFNIFRLKAGDAIDVLQVFLSYNLYELFYHKTQDKSRKAIFKTAERNVLIII